MGRRFAQIAITPQVKRNQEMHGSRRQYQRVEDHIEQLKQHRRNKMRILIVVDCVSPRWSCSSEPFFGFDVSNHGQSIFSE